MWKGAVLWHDEIQLSHEAWKYFILSKHKNPPRQFSLDGDPSMSLAIVFGIDIYSIHVAV